MNRSKGFLFLMTGVLVCSHGLAHHAFVEFDRGQVVEVEGELISVLWANPHIRFPLRYPADQRSH